MRIQDKKFLEFPLCLLAIDDADIFEKIISYSIFAYSQKIERAGDELSITTASINKTSKIFNELNGFVERVRR